MFVLIAGGGRTGAQLASFLVAQNHEVHLIEDRRDVLAHIHRDLPTEVIYEGNAIDPQVLERAGVARAQVLATCLAGDADNLALCFLARTRYKVPRTIACINNPRNAWLFNQSFHVDVALNQADILASLIEQEMSLGDMMTLLKLRRGKFSLVEEKIPPGARAVGMAIKDLPLPPNRTRRFGPVLGRLRLGGLPAAQEHADQQTEPHATGHAHWDVLQRDTEPRTKTDADGEPWPDPTVLHDDTS